MTENPNLDMVMQSARSRLSTLLRRLGAEGRMAWGASRGAAGWVGSAILPYYRRILPAQARELIPERLRLAAKHRLKISDAVIRVHHLSVRLNELGFVDRARRDLLQLSGAGKPEERRLASWELAVWHANRATAEDAAVALKMLDRGLKGETNSERIRRAAVLRAECHEALGDTRAAGQTLHALLEVAPHPDIYLGLANLETKPRLRLEWVNNALRQHGLTELSILSDRRRPLYDRLAAATSREPTHGPTISVIVPAFNSAVQIGTALETLSAQTWRNLEVLVVDDASTDQTTEIVKAFAARDPRIRLVCCEDNRGSYVARNIGLREATGEFVTTHDADDWSHPQKLEIQARHLIANPDAAANMSQQSRASSALRFHRRGNPGFYIFENLSSLMFRRELVGQRLGYWDSVRFGADSEFIQRIRASFGNGAIVSLVSGPLSFQRQSESSLTADRAFGYHGFAMGARLAYHKASRRFHRDARQFFYGFPLIRRPFPVPEPMRPVREVDGRSRRLFDVILVSDFRIPRGLEERSVTYVGEERRLGHRVGLIHMPCYDLDPTTPVLARFHELENKGEVEFIVAGERVSCARLVVLHAPSLEEFQQFVPDVHANEVQIVGDGVPAAPTASEALGAWRDSHRENANRYFGTSGLRPMSDDTP